MADVTSFKHDYRGKKENSNAVLSTKGAGKVYNYKPAGKEDRAARKRIYDRYTAMRDHPLRKEAERRWDLGDKMHRMWSPERDPDDWRADIVLPDGFAAIQTHMQETITLRPRPTLEGVEGSDETLHYYVNHIYQYAMDKTDFDSETYKARNTSAIRGDAYTIEEYRYEKRKIKDPISVEDGVITYKEREVIDYDDVYTRWIDNFSVFMDETVDDSKYAKDCVVREVIDYDTFKKSYTEKPGFNNIEHVVSASNVPKNAGFFKLAEDMAGEDVEILHYSNRLTDSYDVLANNVVIRTGPLPSRHKELPVDKWTFYPIPGQQYGMGIPQIIYTLVEERRTGRNMASDRNKMGINKMFFVNDLFDIEEEDLTPRPHGLIKVNTNGLPINQAIVPLEYGDVPGSSLRFDDALLMEERRAHGLDDRPAQTAGGTATESAIISEAAQKRINLINTLQNWNTLSSIGKKKWSNIQFFYPAGRMEEIMEDNEVKKKKVYKTIKADGREFKVVGDPDRGEEIKLIHGPYDGSTRIKLDPTFARFMEGNYDVVVDTGSNIAESRAVKFGRITEMLSALSSNPLFARYIEGEKTVRRLWILANEDPKDWMPGDGMTEADLQSLALLENDLIMSMAQTNKVFQLPGTPGATEAHTLVHLSFVESEDFKALPQPIQDVMTNHIAMEHDQNPNTNSMADKLKELGGGGQAPVDAAMAGMPPTGGDVVPPGMPGGPAPAEMGMDGTTNGGDVTAGNVA